MNLPGLRWTDKALAMTGGSELLEETGEVADERLVKGGAARNGVPTGSEY